MKIKDIGALFLLAALWGASFLFIRISSPVLGPFLTIELRVLIAGLALLLYSFFINHVPKFKQLWKQYLIIGALNAAIPFTLIAKASLNLNASLTSILNSTTPLFTAIIASSYLKEQLTFKKELAIIIGGIGVIILLGWSPITLSSEVIFSVALSLLAAISYAFAGVYAKKTFTGIDPLSLAIGQQLAASLLLLPITIRNFPSLHMSNIIIISVISLALFCTALAYLLYFYLISSVGPTKTLSVTFLIPLFGVIWSVIFLGEKITAGIIIGLLIILSSIYISSDIDISTKGIETK